MVCRRALVWREGRRQVHHRRRDERRERGAVVEHGAICLSDGYWTNDLGAGGGASGATLATTIAGCTDSNHITLSTTASTSIASLSINDAAMTAGSNVLSSSSSKFSSAMVGYTIYVPGAGASGGVLQTTVSGIYRCESRDVSGECQHVERERYSQLSVSRGDRHG